MVKQTIHNYKLNKAFQVEHLSFPKNQSEIKYQLN